ncbi:ABC transporter permease [Georgenia ruanii]|uniref:Transport permease protein n=1 Tax=Georgenia ruanii TaxID=348442 RepID=A0A7J9UTC6_9MICO|nr:ABC transporter permease [Georgenia ruanii]MPV87130.1 ABC transporter permease [Georgenia ruanii]
MSAPAQTVIRTRPPGARALRALTLAEARLFLRDPGSAFFALAFPAILLIGVGFAIPGMRDVITDQPEPWAGLRAVDVFAPVALATAIATPALSTMPVALAGYREQGVLRRLCTTPMRPQGVLVSQVVIGVVALVLASVVALAAAALVFDAPAPRQPATALLAFVLGAAAMFGVGLLIAARAGKASTAGSLGMLVYFPMLFFAGMWTPGPIMPDAVAKVAAWTPLGAASQALTAAWFEGGVPAMQLLVMAGYVAVLYPLAARLFRWS